MTQAITDYNRIPQRFHKYDSSDRAKQLVQKSFAMNALFSGVWPSQWSTPEAPEFHDVLGQAKAAGFNVLAACTSADSVGGDLNAEFHALEDMVPEMHRRRRIQAGTITDITIFDPAKVTDNSDLKFGSNSLAATGIPYVIVNRTVVVKNSEDVEGAFPGQPIRNTVID